MGAQARGKRQIDWQEPLISGAAKFRVLHPQIRFDLQGEGPLPVDVVYSVNGTFVDSVDSLRSALDDLKSADAIALQVEVLGSLHHLVLETDK